MAHPGPPFTGDRRRRPWLTQACRSREIDTAVRHSPKPAVHGRSAPPSSAAHPSPCSWEIDVPVSPERPQLPALPERPQVPDRASTSPKEICSAPTKEAGAGAEADSTWLPESLLLPWSPESPYLPWPPEHPAPPWVPERAPPWRPPLLFPCPLMST